MSRRGLLADHTLPGDVLRELLEGAADLLAEHGESGALMSEMVDRGGELLLLLRRKELVLRPERLAELRRVDVREPHLHLPALDQHGERVAVVHRHDARRRVRERGGSEKKGECG